MSMGHKLKMATHKLVTKVKKVEAFGDTDYDELEASFLNHLVIAQNVQTELSAYAEAIKRMGSASETLGDALDGYYRSGHDGSSKAATIFKNAQAKIGQHSSSSMEGSMADKVTMEWAEYCGFLRAVKARIPERKQALGQYDYYKQKVSKLRSEPDSKGIKLPQNEEKLESAEQEYERINTELKQVFEIILSDSPNAFHPRLHALVTVMTDLFQQMSISAAEMRVLTQSPDEYGCPIGREPKYVSLLSKFGSVALEERKSFLSRPRKSTAENDSSSNLLSPRVNDPPPSPREYSNQRSSKRLEDSPDAGPLPIQDDPISIEENGTNFNPGKLVRALFDFESQNEDELSFKEGDELTIVEELEEGWWKAERNGKQGMIPYNYVEPIM